MDESKLVLNKAFEKELSEIVRVGLFMRGIFFLMLALVLYILLQILGYVVVENDAFVDQDVFLASILLNCVLTSLLFICYAIARHRIQAFYKKPTHDEPKVYGLMVIAIYLLFIASLAHVHIIGSLNSLHHLLVVTVLLVVSWFLRWRDVLLFFVLGNLGLVGIVALEVVGFLSYAPFFTQGAELAEIFLDWRTIFGQSANYILVLTICTFLVWKARTLVEDALNERKEANDALSEEIEERKLTEEENKRLIEELQDSLQQVKTLSGLLPICSRCKKIRDDQGYWNQLESFFRNHAPEVVFTHSICPDCLDELYPKFYNNKATPKKEEE